MIRRFIGNDMTRPAARLAVEATGIRMPRPRRMHPGNLSSLHGEKSAFLQHMQGGYFNPGIQRARYARYGTNPVARRMNAMAEKMSDPNFFANFMSSAGSSTFDSRGAKGLSHSNLSKRI